MPTEPPSPQRVLLTGAAGRMGTMLRDRLRRPARTLRLLDLILPNSAMTAETMIGSATDLAVMERACQDVDAVIHLAGLSREAPFQDMVAVNIFGTYNVLEAAHRAGIRRVILASSNHAAGRRIRYESGSADLPADIPTRPDSFYGWSKTALESLGQLYADTYGMDVICLRIGTCTETPATTRALATWLSPDDAARLCEAALTAPAPGFRVLWGISRNTRRWWSLAEGETLGYHPVDDAERFAQSLIAEQGEPDPTDAVHRRVGGGRADAQLGDRSQQAGIRHYHVQP